MTSKQPITDWGNTLYSGAEDIGVFKANLFMYIAVIVACVLIVIGLIMVSTDDSDKYMWVTGYVKQPNCTKASTMYDDKGHMIDTYKCNIVVSYNIDGKVNSKKIYLTGNESYIKDEPIQLIVKKSDHNDVQLSYTTGYTVGGIMLIVSIVIVALAYLNYYLTHNYHLFAAAQGTTTVVGLFR